MTDNSPDALRIGGQCSIPCKARLSNAFRCRQRTFSANDKEFQRDRSDPQVTQILATTDSFSHAPVKSVPPHADALDSKCRQSTAARTLVNHTCFRNLWKDFHNPLLALTSKRVHHMCWMHILRRMHDDPDSQFEFPEPWNKTPCNFPDRDSHFARVSEYGWEPICRTVAQSLLCWSD